VDTHLFPASVVGPISRNSWTSTSFHRRLSLYPIPLRKQVGVKEKLWKIVDTHPFSQPAIGPPGFTAEAGGCPKLSFVDFDLSLDVVSDLDGA